jgi:hypothetical protein
MSVKRFSWHDRSLSRHFDDRRNENQSHLAKLISKKKREVPIGHLPKRTTDIRL